MNKQPVSYLQTDARWKNLPYRVKGENATIGDSGCGPTAAAMAIETLTGKTVTPVDTCKWSVDHGYKAFNQGTYYGYFTPQFEVYNIGCERLLGSRLTNQPKHEVHDRVKKAIQQGYYAIALMGPGLWTYSGHFVLVWDWDDKVRINDPASRKAARLNGDPALFRDQVRLYWLIDARDYNKGEEEVTYEDWKKYMDQYRAELSAKAAGDYAQTAIKTVTDAGIMVNSGTAEKPAIDRPADLITRQEVAIVASKLAEGIRGAK